MAGFTEGGGRGLLLPQTSLIFPACSTVRIARVSHCEGSFPPKPRHQPMSERGSFPIPQTPPVSAGVLGISSLVLTGCRLWGPRSPALARVRAGWSGGRGGQCPLEDHLHVVPASASRTPAAARPAPGLPRAHLPGTKSMSAERLPPYLNSKRLPGFLFCFFSMKGLPPRLFTAALRAESLSIWGEDLAGSLGFPLALPEDYLGRELSLPDPRP